MPLVPIYLRYTHFFNRAASGVFVYYKAIFIRQLCFLSSCINPLAVFLSSPIHFQPVQVSYINSLHLSTGLQKLRFIFRRHLNLSHNIICSIGTLVSNDFSFHGVKCSNIISILPSSADAYCCYHLR